MNGNIYENQHGVVLVCIDSYEDGILLGRMFHPYFGSGISIKSTIDFLWKLESMLESIGVPHANYEIRTFAVIKKAKEEETICNDCKKGKKATFALRFLFRQNFSWQGTLVWSEGKKEKNFRSVLELLFLMDSVLRKHEDS